MFIIPPKIEIKIGEKINRLTILKETEPYFTKGGHKKRMIEVICDCGTIKVVRLEQVRSNNTKSCGCYNLEKSKLTLKTHGLSNTRLYRIWKDMKRRCDIPTRNNYVNYGGRGIKVCEEWYDYTVFHSWAMSNGYEDTLSIERVDNDGNYEPNNCEWITNDKQKLNTRQQREFIAIDPNGKVYESKIIKHFAKEHGLATYCISDCLNGRQLTHKGWTFKHKTN